MDAKILREYNEAVENASYKDKDTLDVSDNRDCFTDKGFVCDPDEFVDYQFERFMQESQEETQEDENYSPEEIQEMLVEFYEEEDKMTTKSDPTNPSHYNQSRMQHWDVVQDWGLDYLIGCATKYLSRAGKKSSAHLDDVDKEIQDLEKSIVYIKKRIEVLKRQKYPDNDWK